MSLSLTGSPPAPVVPTGKEQGLGDEPNNEIATPKSSLKRPRTDDVDEALEAPSGTSKDVASHNNNINNNNHYHCLPKKRQFVIFTDALLTESSKNQPILKYLSF
jgi:hypothetical protein